MKNRGLQNFTSKCILKIFPSHLELYFVNYFKILEKGSTYKLYRTILAVMYNW